MTLPPVFSHCLTFCSTIDDSASWVRSEFIYKKKSQFFPRNVFFAYRRVGTLIVATIYLQLIQNRYMFRSFTVLQCSHQHCVQPVASGVEVVGYI